MNKYFIQQKIKTLAYVEGNIRKGVLPDEWKIEIDLDGIKFKHWDFNIQQAHIGQAWVAEKIIDAENSDMALKQIFAELSTIIPKVCFVSQCFMDFPSQSFLILKLNENVERFFHYRYTHEGNGVGLNFGDEEIESYNKLKDYKYQSVFRYLQECNNVPTYFAKLALLFPALEAMSGKVQKTKPDGQIYTTYDKDLMIEILGGELYKIAFGENGLRHRFSHGEFEFRVDEDYVDKIYQAIITYFNQKFATKIPQNVVSPQRHFSNNYYETRFWLKPINSLVEINLPTLHDDLNTDNLEFTKFELADVIKNY